jgi:hypothetical protein
MLARPLQPSLLQREVPLRRLIRIIDQHQPRIEPQPLRLLNHRLLILPHKSRPKEFCNRSNKRNPIKNVPGRIHINPASRSRHRSHRSQTGKPLLPRANRLISPIRQHKINLRRNLLPINPQQLVRRRIRTRSMRRHPKPRIPPVVFTVLNRLKVLRLLMNTRPAPPPPRLMHKRPMRRIHQPDNPMVYIAWQLRRQMRGPVPSRKLRHLRNRRQLTRNPPHPSLGQIHPRIPIPLFTRKSPGINLRRVEPVMARQRRNLPALPRTRLKPPPMVLARHSLPIEPPRRQRNPPMRTKIPHRKQPAIRLPPEQQRHSQQQSRRSLSGTQPLRPHRRIPIPKDQLRRRTATPTHLNKITHHPSAYDKLPQTRPRITQRHADKTKNLTIDSSLSPLSCLCPIRLDPSNPSASVLSL